MFKLHPIPLTEERRLTTLVEHRTAFTLDKCELNFFETHEQAEKVRLNFGGFTITSMLRGKKVLHQDKSLLDYVPGQTFLVPAEDEMIIDFPEAQKSSPTQCTALVVDAAYLKQQLDFINEKCSRDDELGLQWDINRCRFLDNSEEIAAIGNKIIKVFQSNDPLKEVLVDLKIKELLLALMQNQNRRWISHGDWSQYGNERIQAVVQYIKNHLTEEITMEDLCSLAYMSKSSFYRTFTNELGTTPNQLILHERINKSKLLLRADYLSIKEIAFEVGFSDPNYFTRMFKKMEGVTPAQFKSRD